MARKAEPKKNKIARKPKSEKLREQADKILLTAHPESVRIAINKAHGIASNVVCPFCEGKFDVKLGEKANAELLKTIIEHVKGRPKQVQEVDLKATMEIDSGQNIRLFVRTLESLGIGLSELQEFLQKKNAAELPAIEAEFKAIEEPKLPEPEVIQPPESLPAQAIASQTMPEPPEVTIETSEQYAVKE